MIVTPVLDASANFSTHVLQPAARSLAFACFAGLALAAFRVRHVGLRLAIWRVVLLVALAMPLLGLMLPPLPVFVPLAAQFVPTEQPAAEVAPSHQPTSRTILVNQATHSNSAKLGVFNDGVKSSDPADATDIVGTTSAPHPFHASAATAKPRRAFSWLAAAAGLYLAVAVFMLIRLALGVILGRRLERESQRIEDSHVLARLDFFTRAAGLRRPPRLAESELLSVPVTFGVRRPAILLPAGWRDWEPAELDAVLAHEISHVVRRDALAERLALLHRAMFWFSPLSWWLARQLADLAEEASDDAALAAGTDRTLYAETLLAFFAALEAAPGRVWWQGVSMATAGQAEKRVDRILEWKGSVAMRLKKPVVIAYVLLAIPMVCLLAAFRPTIENFHAKPSQQAALPASRAPEVPPQQSAQPPAPPAAPAAPANVPAAAPVAVPALAPMPSVTPIPSLAPAEPAESSDTVVRPLVLATVTGLVMPSVSPMVRVVPVPPLGGPEVSVAPVVHVHPFLPPPLQSTTIHRTRIADYNDETFAILSGKNYVSVSSSSTSMGSSESGDTGDSEGRSGLVNSLRQSFPGDFIWFIRGGKAYIIRDPATIKQAMDFFAPSQAMGRQQEELGRQQEALGAQQETLGAKQEALAEQMQKVRVQIPDMTAELQKLEAEVKKLGADGTQEDLSRVQEKIGEIQARIGELQSQAGEKQSELGEQQGALGEEQGKLGRQQGKLGEMQAKLGEQQEKASQQAGREMKKLLDQAIAGGLAKPA